MNIFGNNPLNVTAMGDMKIKVVLAQFHSCFVELWTVFSFTLLILCILDDIFVHITSLYTLEIDLLWQFYDLKILQTATHRNFFYSNLLLTTMKILNDTKINKFHIIYIVKTLYWKVWHCSHAYGKVDEK